MKNIESIDITPKWACLIIPMIEILKNPKACPQAKKDITNELIRLAQIVDDQNEKERSS